MQVMSRGPDLHGIDPKGREGVVAAGPAAELEDLSAAVDDSIRKAVEVAAANEPHSLNPNGIEQHDRVQKIGVLANAPNWIRGSGLYEP